MENRVAGGRMMEGRLIMDSRGVNLGWQQKEKVIQEIQKPIFEDTVRKYEPVRYGPHEMDKAFTDIKELIRLSETHHFTPTFFITPFYHQLYLNHAEALLQFKLRLARITDLYDFSGFNSITTDTMNYHEEIHYRYLCRRHDPCLHFRCRRCSITGGLRLSCYAGKCRRTYCGSET